MEITWTFKVQADSKHKVAAARHRRIMEGLERKGRRKIQIFDDIRGAGEQEIVHINDFQVKDFPLFGQCAHNNNTIINNNNNNNKRLKV